MDRSSKAITLALIGSAFLLGGCQKDEPEEDDWQDPQAAGHGGGVGRGVFIAPRIGGGFGGGAAGGARSAPSARGGFGATGASGASGVGS